MICRRVLRGLSLIVFAVAAVPGSLRAETAAETGLPRVGRISVVCRDVYDAQEAGQGWFYRAAAALHVTTREAEIRKFLLFREGDPLNEEKLAQTERNLRAQPFLKTATVRSRPAGDGVVDIEVETQDTWTTEPRVEVSRSGGFTSWGFALMERNLFGTGRKLKLSYDESPHRIRRYLDFSSPHLLGPYWNATLVLGSNSDGQEGFGALVHPFTSLNGRWSAGGNYGAQTYRDRVYQSGEIASEFGVDHRAWEAAYGRALVANSAKAVRLVTGVSRLHDRFEPLPSWGPAPPDREFSYLYVRGEILGNRVVKMNFVNLDTRFEDFDLAPRLTALVGLSPSALGPDETTELVELIAAKGFQSREGTLFLTQLRVSSRLGTDAHNTLVVGEMRGVHRFSGHFPQTLVGRLEVLGGWDLDPDLQYFVDGDAGVRGYPLYAYEGTRRVLMNLEHRISTGRELLQFLSPGAAVFVDGGAAVPAGRDPRWSDFKSDVGLGLRIGLPRAATHAVLRVDVAWPLSADRDGRRTPLVSFSSAQAF